MALDALVWHTALYATLAGSCYKAKKKKKKEQSCESTQKGCAVSWNRTRTIIACEMCFLTVYASPVGLFLLYHGVVNTDRVGDVSALALDYGGGDCRRRHGWVSVS